MSEALERHLSQVYRRDILGESVVVEMPEVDTKLILDIRAELARIDGLRLGANLVNRDFVSWQNKRALERLLAQIEEAQRTQEG